MRAFWMEPNEVAASEDEVRAQGIHFERFDPSIGDAAAKAVQATRKLASTESGELTAGDEAAASKESDEHAHLSDEVRLVMSGAGIYDIRAKDERWIRLWVAAGDLVVVPAKRYHRFLLGAEKVSWVQPFDDRAGLMPLYRVSNDATRAV